MLPRLALVAALVGALALVLASDAGSRKLGVPRMKPSFADTAVITDGWDCSRRGYDVLKSNPCDQYGGRRMNYPRLWLAPGHLGLGRGATNPIAIGLIVLFLASIWFLTTGIAWKEAGLWLVVACSPPVLFGLERGNTDLLMFALLTFALIAAARALVWPAAGAIGFAAVLKLYPIFAVGTLARRHDRSALIAAGTLIGGFAAYALATRHDLRLIADATPVRVLYSYGPGALLDNVQAGEYGVFHPFRFFGYGIGRVPWLAIPVAVIAGGAVLSRALGPEHGGGAAGDWRPDGLVAAAALLSGTYLLGNNYDYRLIFVLLAVPQLLSWQRRPGRRRLLARTALAAMLVAFWAGSTASSGSLAGYVLSPRILDAARLPLDELANLVLQVLLAAGAFSVLRARLATPAPAGPAPARG